MRPVSEPSARIVSQNVSRKYIALGRLLSQWPQIVGEEFSALAQPVKINYRKSRKGENPTATLDITTSAAHATILTYQKGLILARINQIFGDDWIKDIRFVASPANTGVLPKKKPPLPLTDDQKSYLSDMLENVQDPEIKEKLQNLGRTLLTEQDP